MISNPWITMWFRPKQTIRAVIEDDPTRGIIAITTALALENFFFYGHIWSIGLRPHFFWIVIFGLICSPFLGYLWVFIVSHIFFYTGSWFKGKAPLQHLKAAVAWSKIPALGILLSWICMLVMEPDEAFIYEGGGNPYTTIFHFLNLVFAIWSMILLIGTIQEVQKFSLGKSLCNIVVAWTFFSIPFTLLLLAVYFVFEL